MNSPNLRNWLLLALALFAAAFAAACGGSGSTPTPPPPVGGFSNASLKGQYAFSMSGFNGPSGQFFGRVGSFIADGNGNITNGVEDVSVFQTSAGTLAFTPSQYSVQADGRGVISLTNSTGTLTFSITMLTPTNGLIVETDGIATGSGTFALQNTNLFNTGGLSGAYVFDFSGLDSGGSPDSIVGQLVSTGSGTLSSGLLDENDGAMLSGPQVFTGGANYVMDATNGATFGKGNVTFVANGVTYNYIFYIVDGGHVHLLENSLTGSLTVGDAVAQSSVPSSNSTFSGNFVYLASGSGTTGDITTIGRFTADGNGGLNSVVGDTNFAGTIAKLPSGTLSATTYAIDTTNAGTGRGTLTFTDSHLGVFQYIFYLGSPSFGVIQNVSKNSVADGSLAFQTAGPFTNTSLAGNYGLNFSGISSNSSAQVTGEEDFVGQIVLSSASSNNVNGAVDFSEFSSNQGVFPNIVVSGNGLTIGGDGTNSSSGSRNALSLKLNSTPSSTLNFAPYIVNSQTMFVAGTDSNRTISGIISVQAP
jgi:hypothetical protein